MNAGLNILPEDGTVPPMPGWRWIHAPGHSVGQVALWREAELHGPPMNFTVDWPAAHASVKALAALEPERAITGHGRPLEGAGLRDALHALARDFEEVAVPKHGRYVGAPATAEDGTAYPAP
ncbi:hypothetical protein SAMN05192565_110129 [Methylobacterium gossipiicola]|uniref:Metallo-beta-lactamase superfamily protein n=1 Tax=Methylobacterium gossipiicola TaxID=582675 RepID=A0A1I2UL25_9HYPH|nr:hypothetical protein SAMN05192565_110129 [Methylobacterium gossipiicola]